MGLVISCHR